MTGSMASLLLGSRWDHEHEEEEREQGDEFADPLGASSLTSSPSLQPPFFPFAIAKATSRFEAHQHRHSSSASSGPASDALALAVASDWNSYKASVMHRFASTGTITVTTVSDHKILTPFFAHFSLWWPSSTHSFQLNKVVNILLNSSEYLSSQAGCSFACTKLLSYFHWHHHCHFS